MLKESDQSKFEETKLFNWHMPCQFDRETHGGKKDMITYYMVYNYTLATTNMFTKLDSVMKKDMSMISLKLSIDNAILEHKAIEHGLDHIPKIEQEIQGYPLVPNRIFKDLDAISMYGTFYLIMVPLSVFMVIYDELMREKIDKLRMGMQLLGTKDNAYWVSWIITAQILNIYESGLMILVGNYYGFDVFTKTPAYIFFGLYFLITSAYIAMACFFATLMTSRSQAFAVNFSLILCSMLINMILSEPTILKKIFFNTEKKLWMYIATNSFYLIPCF
jgi:hypothetical protein